MTQSVAANRSTENITLVVRRVIKASRQRLFDAWTKPELLKEWFGPEHMTATEVSSDFRVGGTYRIEMLGSTENCAKVPGQEAPPKRPIATGRYTEIVPNERLSFTWRGDWGPIEDTFVTVEFLEASGGTEVVITHERFANEQMREGHNQGWTGSLNKLARFAEQ